MIDSGFQLTARQKRIRDGLIAIDEKIANAYEGAYRVLIDITNPDRYSQSANSLREVTSLLSRVKDIPQERIEQGGREEEESKKDNMVKKLRRRFDLEEGYVLPFVQADVCALLKTWNTIHAFLCAVAHHGKLVGKNVTEDTYLLKVNEFEEILDHFVSPPSITMVEIDRFLSIEHPTKEDTIDLLKVLVPSYVYVEYFFTRLTTDNWLIPLKEMGIFSVPQNSITSNGTILFPAWWPSIYLKKMASVHPDIVVEIIYDMRETDNIRVHADLIEAALNMDALKASKIVPLTMKWVNSKYPSLVLIRSRELLNKLVEEGVNEPALQLLQSLLTLDKRNSEKEPSASGNHFIDWEIGQLAEDVIPLLFTRYPSETLTLLCGILEERLRRNRDEIAVGYYHVWRPAIEDHEQNSPSDDIDNFLISAIRDGLLSIGRDNPKLLEKNVNQLDSYGAPVFKRLKIYTVNQYSDLLVDDLQAAVTDVSVLVSLDFWHEMYYLLKDRFVHLPESVKQEFFNLVRSGLPTDIISERCKELHDGETAEERTKKIQAVYRMRLLTPIRGQLPPDLSEMLANFEADYGPLEHPDFLEGYILTSWGHEGLDDADDSMQLDRDEIIAIFNGSVKKSLPFAYDIENALEKAVAANIEKFIEPPLDLSSTPISFIVHVQQGIYNAAKQNNPVDWHKILAFTDALASHDWEASHPQQNTLYSSDTVYSACLRILTQFLETSKDVELKEDVWRTIKKLLEICLSSRADKKPRWKEGDDLIIHALNDNDGMVTNVLIQYLLWSKSVVDQSINQQMDVEPREILERVLTQTMDVQSIARTTIGLRFVHLYSRFKDWTKTNLDIIFPDVNSHRKGWKMTWEGYIAATNLERDIYLDLRPQYVIAIRKIDGLSEHARNRTIEHVILVFIHGLEDLNQSLLKRLAASEKPEVRSAIFRSMGFYLNSLVKKPEVKGVGEITDRCREYWEWRLNELEPSGEGERAAITKELEMVTELFISIPSLEEEDISKLSRTVDLTDGKVERPQEIIDKFKENPKIDAMATLGILKRIVRAEYPDWERDFWRKDLYSLLEILFVSEDDDVRQAVKMVAEISVKQGFFEFEKFTTL